MFDSSDGHPHPNPPVRRGLVALGVMGLLVVSASVTRPDDALPPNDLRGSVTIEQVVAAALTRNPRLNANRVDVTIQEALVVQAGRRPNPSVHVDVEDVAGSGSRQGWDAGQTTLSLSQPFELGGLREKRQRVAELARDATAWDLEVQRRELLADVGKAFVTTLVAQERVVLADELCRITDGSVRSVATSVEAGAVSPVEKSRAEVNLSRAQAARLGAVRELSAARTALGASWGAPTPTFDRVVGRLEPIAKPPALASVLAQVQMMPDLARAESALAQRGAALALERARRIPDVTLTAGGRHYADGSDAALVLGFSLPLPLFDRNDGNILAAARAETKARLEKSAAAVTVETRARQAHAALEAAFEQVTTLRDHAIPQATRAYEGARDAYSRGLFRYLEVLDAQRTLFELRSEHLLALDAYYQAAAELSRWIGDASAPTAVNATVGGTR